ncbi:MAG TPA: heme peroxidase family protein [Actinoplanes sp.]|nr:heme peroxidase family protein [Actinoplanes sp.]
MNPDERSSQPGWQHSRSSRRTFLAGAAALSSGALVGGLPSAAHAAEGGTGLHGAELRGMYLTSKDRLAEGRFGLMFKRLPAYAPPDTLLDGLAQTMVEPDTSDTFLNTSPRLFAGFTFIAQFLDHDITLDTTPLDQQLEDPDATVNFRTARYDLDSVYGRGPALDPQLYDPADRDKLLLTANVNGVLDVPRNVNGRAIIGDPRNDENLIIVQFHKAVIQFHNRIVDDARAQGIRAEWVFETARRLARWHYQWAIIHDFLPRFVGDELVGPNGTVYKEVTGKSPVINLIYYKPTNRDDRPFMPVEFSVAAYRFGHSLIRPFYVISDAGKVDIFGPAGGFNLNGGRPIPSNLVMVWKNILPTDPTFPARPPRKIDTKLSIPLTALPGSAVPPPDPTIHLAVRNNRRGKKVGLPSGQQVAKAMRVTALSNATLGLTDPGWGGEAPLWFYILKEAELPPHNAERLGPVGGRIMTEVLVGLLQRDPNSYLYLNAAWKPAPPIAPTTGQFTFVDLLKYAGAA